MLESDCDGGNTAPPHPPSDLNGAHVKTALALDPFSPSSDALQPQFRLNDDDDIDHDGDDEQETFPEDDSELSLSRSRSHSPGPAPAATATDPPPAAHQQQHLQQPLRQPQPHQQQQQQQQQQPPPTLTPTPFVAHVHFHSRVRITSGVRRPRGTRGGDPPSSDSDSPSSSSISAPLHYRSRDTTSRAPLTDRVSRLAAQALQKRRAAAAAVAPSPSPPTPPTASQRLRARGYEHEREHEYTPLFSTGLMPVTYGAAQRRSRNDDDDDDDDDAVADTVTDGADRSRPRIIQSHGEEGIAFGRWPWRALNRHWWKSQIESTFHCCCTDESDADD
ncbi:hypothetical protein BC827DRAFT_1265788 [Russula dissimulans]|nr:hypothetical protein BC827DRAFT_1265788 [Russula dissimulans]